jgi:metal-responsive CopG/Arc/MetJ family transcriptional regulator
MPRTIVEKTRRTTLPLPEPLVQEVDRVITEFSQYAWNRQKFAEEAIREKIFRLRRLQAAYHATRVQRDK